MKHANSRTVTIFRTGTFISRAQGAAAAEYFQQSRTPIGSYFESRDSRKIGSGLTFQEEELLLPLLIDTPADDKEFRKKVTEFFIEISTDVPFSTGKILEVGLEDSNDKPVSKSNMPLQLMDYIRYRHALNHPHVAKSKEEAEGNPMVQYYIFDKDTVQSKNSKKTIEKDAAMQIYLRVKNEPGQVDQMLTLMGVDPREYINNRDGESLKVERLRHLAEENPAQFTTAHNEGDLEIRYWIQTMVNTKVLKKVGSKYLDAETNEVKGNSLEELIFFFKDEDNSGEVVALKARMQEAAKSPVVAEARRTRV